ncbi:hypothetical protein [Lachnoanaerobaculum umeaense]|jgi:hypothetical protein|uniref:Uncharacterized protein n=1 Tax=Lachnoanaerobaculum umeaense TaxID=617123 RepID=A0A385PZN0_9FIRM|nr:hypothetical protein [Lachnoanaerobaculum umeaense]AYA99462.1 hypothetical protein D4A81_05655 [Lachnoanaerobaculum umeaense]PZW99566.1 hypothetical protein C7439_10383 [Lachnoanaerobaculum umeaense]
MVFSKKLYLSSDIKNDYRKYIRSLKFNKSSFLLYVVVFLEGEDKLSLVHNSIFLNNYRKTDALVVGLAFGKKAGIELIAKIVEDTYRSRNDFEYHKFLALEER